MEPYLQFATFALRFNTAYERNASVVAAAIITDDDDDDDVDVELFCFRWACTFRFFGVRAFVHTSNKFISFISSRHAGLNQGFAQTDVKGRASRPRLEITLKTLDGCISANAGAG